MNFLVRMFAKAVEDKHPDVCSVCYEPFVIKADTESLWPRREAGIGDIHNNAKCRGKALKILIKKAGNVE